MAAAAGYTRVREGVALEDVTEIGKDGDSKAGLVLLKYCDGLRLAMLLIPNVRQYCYSPIALVCDMEIARVARNMRVPVLCVALAISICRQCGTHIS